MSRELHLADETFERLAVIAAEKGLTPEEWVAAKVREERRGSGDERPLSEVLDGHIGVLDSGAQRTPYTRHAFSRIVGEKFGEQGIEKQRGRLLTQARSSLSLIDGRRCTRRALKRSRY